MRRCIGAKISTICLDCEKGKASSSGSTECTHCPHGRTSPEGSGLEHISQIAKGEFTKDMEMLNHKIQSARLVFDWHWIVGCCIALFAAVSSNIGLNLQRLSHLENQFVDPFAKHKREKPLSQQVGVCARPRWVLGISLMIVASKRNNTRFN